MRKGNLEKGRGKGVVWLRYDSSSLGSNSKKEEVEVHDFCENISNRTASPFLPRLLLQYGILLVLFVREIIPIKYVLFGDMSKCWKLHSFDMVVGISCNFSKEDEEGEGEG